MDNTPPHSSQSSHIVHLDYDDALLHIKDEEAEIKRLELSTKTDCTKSAATEENAKDERIPDLPFNCSKCGMYEMVHYYGRAPQFVQGLEFLEDTYVMRDPFQAPPPRWKTKPEYFISIGAKCKDCRRMVCKDTSCSFYYTSTYCLRCAQTHLKNLPVEAQVKLRKQLSTAVK